MILIKGFDFLSTAVFLIFEMQVMFISEDFLGLTERLKEQQHFRLKIAPTEQ